VCTLYLVFKEPRHPPTCKRRPEFPTTFAIASVTPFRGTLRAYRALAFPVNPFCPSASRSFKTDAVEPGISAGSHCAFDRRRRVKRVRQYYGSRQSLSTLRGVPGAASMLAPPLIRAPNRVFGQRPRRRRRTAVQPFVEVNIEHPRRDPHEVRPARNRQPVRTL
jgi:hypothetical protein